MASMDLRPGERPPESRRLDRPPSTRFESTADAEGPPTPSAPSPPSVPPPLASARRPGNRAGVTSGANARGLRGGSLPRAIAFALPAALISLLVYVAFAGPLAVSAGLVIV